MVGAHCAEERAKCSEVVGSGKSHPKTLTEGKSGG